MQDLIRSISTPGPKCLLCGVWPVVHCSCCRVRAHKSARQETSQVENLNGHMKRGVTVMPEPGACYPAWHCFASANC